MRVGAIPLWLPLVATCPVEVDTHVDRVPGKRQNVRPSNQLLWTIPVAHPADRVFLDVATKSCEIVFAAHDMLVRIPLPKAPPIGGPSGFAHPIAISIGGQRLEPMDHIGQ